MTNNMNTDIKQQAHKEFEVKWKRIENTITGHISGRKIWCVDEEDEDSYVFVDESIKSFIDSIIDRTVQMTEERIVVVIEKIDIPRDMYYQKIKEDIISLITNKNDINKEL